MRVPASLFCLVRFWSGLCLIVGLGSLLAHSTGLLEAQEFIPRRQSQPPGPPLSPEEALRKMTVPEGFTVELVASEPMIQNPVAMCFDEQGRIWLTESFEYPRRQPGPGRDRIKVLEDTTGDGRADKMTVFAEGLNIPSGIAVGYGGVWVANAPDLLFMRDTTGDLKADTVEVVLTGFGRTDTHELPNSFTWGPDGWLYGLNGVFNRCHVVYSPENPNQQPDHPGWKFDAAMFRVHPVTREFQLFAEGTSNPWGIAFDPRGEAFVSACVIDHLWHITRGGYYHRQAGAYPPFTWKIESIVDYKHQLAAYCGIEYFDSDAYPAEYRNRLYMGNIHGNCINVDGLQRHGSTYRGVKHEDFLTANDVWFMPVSQKTGPDGCLYVLDWYDRYHCYQDANADPEGVDRSHGRLYRIRHRESPAVSLRNLAERSFQKKLDVLGSGNSYQRHTARRLLQERLFATLPARLKSSPQSNPEAWLERLQLQQIIQDEKLSKSQRLQARMIAASQPDAWKLLATAPVQDAEKNGSRPASAEEIQASDFRVWDIRAWQTAQQWAQLPADHPALGGAAFQVEQSEFVQLLRQTARDGSRDVLLQTVIAAEHVTDPQSQADVLLAVQERAGDDVLIPRLVWRRLENLLGREGVGVVLAELESRQAAGFPNLDPLLPRIVERALAHREITPAQMGQLFSMFAIGSRPHPTVASQCLQVLAERIRNRELSGEALAETREQIDMAIVAIVNDPQHPLHRDSVLLATSWQYEPALKMAAGWVADASTDVSLRLAAYEALCGADGARALQGLQVLLNQGNRFSAEEWRFLLNATARLDQPTVAELLLAAYQQHSDRLRPAFVDVLTQRKSWGALYVEAVRAGQVSREEINATQLRRLLDIADEELAERIVELWGKVREQPQVDRQRAIVRAARIIRETPGDPHRGLVVYQRVCGQCHKLHGEGADVGPDLTRNGRNNYAQLLSNVFDPNLVIGEAYQARTIVTEEGRVVTGLVAEETDARIVLKVPGGKPVTIPRDEIEFMKTSDLSLMPDQLENLMTDQELADLFALLTLDKHPDDPQATELPGVRELETIETEESARFPQILSHIAPGFECRASGHRGMAWLAEFRGRRGVLRVHPLSPQTPCELKTEWEVPAGQQSKLLLEYAAHPGADWQLKVLANQKTIATRAVSDEAASTGWHLLELDLSEYAGQTLTLSLQAHALNRWNSEYAYWHRIDLISTPRNQPQEHPAKP